MESNLKGKVAKIMEFISGSNRSSAQQPAASSRPHVSTPQNPSHLQLPPHKKRKHIDWAARTVRLELFIVILGSALLLAALAVFLAFSTFPDKSEARLVDPSKYQAVNLRFSNAADSYYFGRITALNDNYLVLQDVYLITASQQNQPSQNNPQPELIKLGCQQLHSPYDQMIINRSQVAFWENLREDGKLVKAIKQYQEQNPNGPDCTKAQQTQSSDTNASTPAPAASTPSSSSSSSGSTSTSASSGGGTNR